MCKKQCLSKVVELDPRAKELFTQYRKSSTDGVFDVYTGAILKCSMSRFLTGPPDNNSRRRIIGDYRRIALYGIDRLIEAKQQDLKNLTGPMTDARINLRDVPLNTPDQLSRAKAIFDDYFDNVVLN